MGALAEGSLSEVIRGEGHWQGGSILG